MAVCNRFWTVNDMYKSGDSDIYTVMSRVHLLNCYSQSTGLKLEISTSPLILRVFPRLLRSSLYCHFHSLSCTFSLRLLVATIKRLIRKKKPTKVALRETLRAKKKKKRIPEEEIETYSPKCLDWAYCSKPIGTSAIFIWLRCNQPIISDNSHVPIVVYNQFPMYGGMEHFRISIFSR